MTEKVETPTANELKSDGDLVTREQLYKLVWSQPMLKIAARYGVSSSYLARVCTALRVPRPARGYWAKLEAGQNLPVPTLPEASPEHDEVWNRGGSISAVRALPRPDAPKPNTATRVQKSRSISSSRQHELVVGAKAQFSSGRVTSYQDLKYLKPAKKLLLDMVVTETGLDAAIEFADHLFKHFEANGHRVVIAPHGQHFSRAGVEDREFPPKKQHGNRYLSTWSPMRCTVVYFGTVAIGLTLIEMSESIAMRYVNGKYIRERDYVPSTRRTQIDRTWTTSKDFGTGHLRLQAYSPYPGADWVKQWQETKTGTLQSQTASILRDLLVGAIEISNLVEKAEQEHQQRVKQWELDEQRRKKEEAERRSANALKASKDDLLATIARWAETKNILQFLAEIEAEMPLDDQPAREHALRRLAAARTLIKHESALESI